MLPWSVYDDKASMWLAALEVRYFTMLLMNKTTENVSDVCTQLCNFNVWVLIFSTSLSLGTVCNIDSDEIMKSKNSYSCEFILKKW